MKRFVVAINDFWWGEGLADDLPALTYFLVISLAPFVFGLAAITILLIGDQQVAEIVATETYQFLPPSVQADLLKTISGAREDSSNLLILAIVSMLWTASGAVGIIERGLSRMLARDRYFATIGKLRALVIAGAMALMIILMVTTAVRGSGLVSANLPLGKFLGDRLLVAVNVATLLLVVTLIYKHTPKGGLSWNASLAGGGLACIGLLLIPMLVGQLVGAQDPLKPQGIFITFAVIVLGCSLAAHVLLIGCGTAARVQRRVDAAASQGRKLRWGLLAPKS